VLQLLVTANIVPSALIRFALLMEAIRSFETSVFTEPHGVTSQKIAFFKQTPWPLVRERTIPTERPPLVDEI
jgi:hypothetical protein